MRTRRARPEAGFTILEVLIVTVFIVILLVVLSEVIKTVTDTQARIYAEDYVTTVSGKAMDEIRESGLAARNILVDNAHGRGYLAALDLSEHPMVPGSRLPPGDPTAKLVPDGASEVLTGNVLLLVIDEPPLLIEAPMGVCRVDLARFVVFYLTVRPEKVVAVRDDRLDLVQFTSGVFAEKPSLEAIADPDDRAKAITDLRAMGVETAWTPGAPVDEAFHDLLPAGDLGSTPISNPRITTAPDGWVLPLLGSKRMSIAGNGEGINVPLFAQPVSGAEYFPSGFEVKVVGPSSGRRLLTRLVILVGDPGGHDLVQEAVRVLTLRDF